MAKKKFSCSADEYAYLEGAHKYYVGQAERLRVNPSDAFICEDLQDAKRMVALFTEASETFKIRPGSTRSTDIVLSADFQKQLHSLKYGLPQPI